MAGKYILGGEWQMTVVKSVGVLFFALMLSSCSFLDSDEGVSDMTPSEAVEDAHSVFVATEAALGASDWTEEESWGPCEVARDGYVQHVFVAQTLADLPEITPDLLQSVVDAWLPLGRNAIVARDEGTSMEMFVISDPAYLAGSNVDGSLTQLSLTDRSFLLELSSPCIRGDINALEGIIRP